MTSRDFYNNIPISAERPFSIPLWNKFRPHILVKYEGQYAGKIVDPSNCSFLSGLFHELIVYD